MNQPRKPGGTPSGGQFAGVAHAETDTKLHGDPDHAGDAFWAPKGFIAHRGVAGDFREGDRIVNNDGTSAWAGPPVSKVERSFGDVVIETVNGGGMSLPERFPIDILRPENPGAATSWHAASIELVPNIVDDPDPPTSVDDEGTRRWTNESGELHRDDGPAVLHLDGSAEWFRHGKSITPPETR